LSAFGADGELTTLTYDTGTGLLASLAGESETLTFSYTGDLVTGVTWSGVVSGSVTSTIDAFFRSTTESVGSDPIEYSYDSDGLLTAAGAVQLTRDPESGSITLIELGQLTSTTEYNELGETSRLATSFGSSAVYAVELVYDALGRIDTRVETVQGATRTDSYESRSLGRSPCGSPPASVERPPKRPLRSRSRCTRVLAAGAAQKRRPFWPHSCASGRTCAWSNAVSTANQTRVERWKNICGARTSAPSECRRSSSAGRYSSGSKTGSLPEREFGTS
jgi:hypothetical protein